jgi:hypothetical protein
MVGMVGMAEWPEWPEWLEWQNGGKFPPRNIKVSV